MKECFSTWLLERFLAFSFILSLMLFIFCFIFDSTRLPRDADLFLPVDDYYYTTIGGLGFLPLAPSTLESPSPDFELIKFYFLGGSELVYSSLCYTPSSPPDPGCLCDVCCYT